jgi:hypothetical protein
MNFAKTALDLFYKTFGRRILKTAADNKWVTNMIQKLKSKASTQKIADKVREGIKKDRPFQGFTPKVVKKEKSFIELMKDKGHKFLAKDSPEYLAHIKKTKVVKPKPPKVVNIGDRIIKQMQKEGKPVKFDDLVRIYGKKPPNLKADGGRIDKALPGRSRDI